MLKIEAYIDSFTSEQLKGWAYTPENTKNRVNIELIDKNCNILGKTTANIFRQDLLGSKIGDGTYGFSLKGNLANTTEIRLGIPFALPTPDKAVLKEQRIHPMDMMFKHLFQAFGNDMNAAVRYFQNDGRRSANEVKRLCLTFMNQSSGKRFSLLEFASLYGGVSRYFDLNLFDVTVHSFYSDAREFIQNTFGINTFSSELIPEDFSTQEKFDVVFALSFFEHASKTMFRKWLKKLYDCTAEGGCLIFSTHGLASNRKFFQLNIPAEGFEFIQSDEHCFFSNHNYGLSISTREFVERECETYLGEHPIFFEEGFWHGHQDVYIIKKMI